MKTTKVKRLFAIHSDPFGKKYRTKIAEGTTADFAFPNGFVIEDIERTEEVAANGAMAGGSQSLGLNGQYPMLQANDIKHIEGQLLTLCDATFTNKEQREAFKNVVSNTLWNSYNDHVDRLPAAFSNSDQLTQ